MTARANPLTDRATLPANALGVFVAGLRTLGYDTAPLLAAAGVAPDVFADPDRHVPCEAYGAVLAGAQRQRPTPNLALALARATPLGAWPLLDYLVVTADTVGNGIGQLQRYFRLAGNPVDLTIHPRGDDIRVELSASIPFAIEYDASLMAIHLRAETEGRFAVSALSFQHALDDAGAFERELGCPVADRAAWSGLSLSSDAWRLPLRRRDPILRGVLEAHADAIAARLPARDGLALQVQRALASRLGGGDTRVEAVGRALAMSPRTLQRRLAAEGVTFQRLLDDARMSAASRYLGDPALAIGEIAYLLGYSEPAPFHRAFRRWYGTTPESFRRRFPSRREM